MDETNTKRAAADAMRKAKAAASANDPRVTKQPEIGLGAAVRREMIAALNRVLSNEAILLVKTKKAHWDVVGPQFYALHKLWDEQHALLGARIDEIAERIRQLGGFPIATLGAGSSTPRCARRRGRCRSRPTR